MYASAVRAVGLHFFLAGGAAPASGWSRLLAGTVTSLAPGGLLPPADNASRGAPPPTDAVGVLPGRTYASDKSLYANDARGGDDAGLEATAGAA